MAKHKILTAEEVEVKRDEYNALIIKENELLDEYSKADYLTRIGIAKELKATALKILIAENTISQHERN